MEVWATTWRRRFGGDTCPASFPFWSLVGPVLRPPSSESLTISPQQYVAGSIAKQGAAIHTAACLSELQKAKLQSLCVRKVPGQLASGFWVPFQNNIPVSNKINGRNRVVRNVTKITFAAEVGVQHLNVPVGMEQHGLMNVESQTTTVDREDRRLGSDLSRLCSGSNTSPGRWGYIGVYFTSCTCPYY